MFTSITIYMLAKKFRLFGSRVSEFFCFCEWGTSVKNMVKQAPKIQKVWISASMVLISYDSVTFPSIFYMDFLVDQKSRNFWALGMTDTESDKNQ